MLPQSFVNKITTRTFTVYFLPFRAKFSRSFFQNAEYGKGETSTVSESYKTPVAERKTLS